MAKISLMAKRAEPLLGGKRQGLETVDPMRSGARNRPNDSRKDGT